MQSMLIAVFLLLGAVPLATASSTALDIAIDESQWGANATTPVTFRLTLTDFRCVEDREFAIALWTNASEGVTATFDVRTLIIPVPAGSYVGQLFVGEATAELTTRSLASGDIEVTGSFAADDGPCSVEGGFQPMQMTMSRAVVPDVIAAVPDPEPTPHETSGTPDTNQTVPTPTLSIPTPARLTAACSPDKTCGSIGEYQPDESSKSASAATPGIGGVSLLAALGCLALVIRQTRR